LKKITKGVFTASRRTIRTSAAFLFIFAGSNHTVFCVTVAHLSSMKFVFAGSFRSRSAGDVFWRMFGDSLRSRCGQTVPASASLGRLKTHPALLARKVRCCM
jgi:hypothetical protein